MSNIVIGLAGVKTSGKSTVTNIIRKYFDLKEAALAEKLKVASAETFRVARSDFDDQRYKEVPFAEGPKILTEDSIRSLLTFFKVNPDELIDPVLYTKRIDTYRDIIGMKLESPRKIAQIVGTEVLRRVGEDIHCENLELMILALQLFLICVSLMSLLTFLASRVLNLYLSTLREKLLNLK